MSNRNNTTTPESNDRAADSALSASLGSHPRVEGVLRVWLTHDAKGLTFGTDAEKAAAWQKAASRLERIARKLEDEVKACDLTLRSIDAATELQTARRRANQRLEVLSANTESRNPKTTKGEL